MASMIKTNLYITRKQMRILNGMSDSSGLSMAEIIRRSIDEYIDRKNEPGRESVHISPGRDRGNQ